MLEYLTSLVLEVCFGIRWWDYSKQPYNIQGRVCLAASAFWGLLSVVFMNEIHPFIEKKVKKIALKISSQIQNAVICIALLGTFLDLFFTMYNLIS